MKPLRARALVSRRSLSIGAFVAALSISAAPAVSFAQGIENQRMISSPEYEARNGSWSTYDFPGQFRVNAIHAALLNTGKVLLVAGSGNDAQNFAAGTFRTVVWDPSDDSFTNVPTPSDMFCSGHAFLPDGRLVVAGGTQRYEVLKGQVTHAAGAVTVKNEDPGSPTRIFSKGTELTGPNGKVYRTTNDFTLPPATKVTTPQGATVTASEVVVWAEAVKKGAGSVTTTPGQYAVQGLTGSAVHDVYGLAQKMTLDKQDYQGTQTTYVFDPRTERYSRLGDMRYKRWYPTIVPLDDGRLLASSGLDGTGQVLNGQTEVFDPATGAWTERTDLTRYFPTYPWLYPMADGQRLFYSGSNAGYGPADQGRQPGIWNLQDNSFQPVTGLRDQDLLETSSSVMLPPVQKQTAMVMGGGGVGESARSTARTGLVDLSDPNPMYHDGPDLPVRTRYPDAVNLPDDTVLITGGSSDYRGKHLSDNHVSSVYDPAKNTLHQVASQSVGRDYHSEALLLPDGRVVVMGSNPLYADKGDTTTAPFEQRVEIYSPSYLFRGPRPEITSAPQELHRGQAAQIRTSGPAITSARLMRPSAVTHVTDVEQRTVTLGLQQAPGGQAVTVPGDVGTTPDGWYMLVVGTAGGVPSVAHWVHVSA